MGLYQKRTASPLTRAPSSRALPPAFKRWGPFRPSPDTRRSCQSRGVVRVGAVSVGEYVDYVVAWQSTHSRDLVATVSLVDARPTLVFVAQLRWVQLCSCHYFKAEPSQRSNRRVHPYRELAGSERPLVGVLDTPG